MFSGKKRLVTPLILALLALLWPSGEAESQGSLSRPPTPSAPTAARDCPSEKGGDHIISWGGAAPPDAIWHLWRDDGSGLADIASGSCTTASIRVMGSTTAATHRYHVQVCWESATVTGCSFLSPGVNVNWYPPGVCTVGVCTQRANTTVVALDGRGFQPASSCSYQLTRVGAEPNGNRFLLDEWAVLSYASERDRFSEVLVENASAEHFGQSQGRCLAQGNLSETPRALARSLGTPPQEGRNSAERTSFAMIAHVPHKLNERFMPDPTLSLRPNSVPFTEPPIEALLRVMVGMDSKIQEIETILSDTPLPPQVVRAIRDNLEIEYVDTRRHRMAAYILVRVAQGTVTLQDVLITLPECCPNCPNPPFVCQ